MCVAVGHSQLAGRQHVACPIQYACACRALYLSYALLLHRMFTVVSCCDYTWHLVVPSCLMHSVE